MTTTRDMALDLTRWHYDDASGLVTKHQKNTKPKRPATPDDRDFEAVRRYRARNGLLRYRRGNAAPWEYHACDSRGREVLRAVQANASATPEPSSAAGDLRTPGAFLAAFPGSDCDVTAFSYEPAEGSGDTADFNDSREPRETTAHAQRNGALTPVSREWRVYVRGETNGIGTVSVRTVRAASASAAFSDAANASSLSAAYAGVEDASVPLALRGLPLREETENGGVRAWSYELADYDGVNGTLTVTERSGTTASPDGEPGLSTYTVETRDAAYGLVLRRETRLCGESGDGPLLSRERSGYDAKRRLLGTAYSDGTFVSNFWSCCRLEASVGRDGSRTEYDAVPGNAHWSRTSRVSLGSLPGANGRFPAVETFTDSLGRETNSVRAVMFNGSRDAAYAPQETRTAYPYGTDGCRVTADPLGVATVTRTYYADNAKVTETASGGVTNRATEAFGGATVEERFWDGKWTRETRSTSYGADGCRVETVLAESSDYPAVTKSVTAYDFLGRAVSVATPLGVTSNFYDGATSRLLRVSRTGQPGTLYAYDGLGNVSATATDADGDGAVTYAGTDRINSTATRYEEESNVWWRVTASAVWDQTGVDAALTSSVTRVRMTGLGASSAPATLGLPAGALLTSQTESLDWLGNVTRMSAYTDAGSANVWTVTATPGSVQPSVQKAVAGYAVSVVSSAAVTNGYAYDGFARQTSATDGRGNVSVTHYNGLGQADWTEDAATNRTVYAYDAFGRRSAVTDPLSNATHTACDSLGNVIRTWGSAYPVEYGYDSQGRRISMKTFRDENGAGDETRWLYDGATGLLTNKVYADNSRVAYAYTPDGKLASRVWARGVTTAYAYDALGQLAGINYSGTTPDVSFGHDRLGRTVSAVTAVSSNIFAYSGLALAAETQNGVTVTRSSDALGRSAGFGLADGFTAAYGYDDFGRMNLVVSGTPSDTNEFRYAYLAGTDLVGSMTNSAGFWWRRAYEPNRDLIASVENGFGENAVSGFAYGNDADGRRALRVDSGSVTNLFGYNARSEVTNAVTGTNLFVGAYDGIGNRTAAAWNGSADVYTANALNQYACVRSVGLSYDADGNLVSDGVQTCVWDAENRMITTVPAAHSNGALRVVNGYDHRHRRVLKRVDVLTGYNPAVPPNPPGSPGEWVTRGTTRFVWDGDRIVAETTVSADGTASTNRYFWGADVSGTLDGAAGVGGLLAASLGGTNVVYCCDANGNVTELLDAYGGGVLARYRYGAFGETLVSEGPLASANPWRFSTRYHDDETGLVMFPRRPYSPQLGRFLSRDPVEEDGGLNLYAYTENAPVNAIDPLGLASMPLDYLFIDSHFEELKERLRNELQNMCPKKDAQKWTFPSSSGNGSPRATRSRPTRKEVCCNPDDCKKEAASFASVYVETLKQAYWAQYRKHGKVREGNYWSNFLVWFGSSPGGGNDADDWQSGDGLICGGWASLAQQKFDSVIGTESKCWYGNAVIIDEWRHAFFERSHPTALKNLTHGRAGAGLIRRRHGNETFFIFSTVCGCANLRSNFFCCFCLD